MSQLDVYDGSGDTIQHLERCHLWMELHSAIGPTMYKGFILTLIKVTRKWYRLLKSSFISSFIQLSHSFMAQFKCVKVRKKPKSHIFTVK